MKLDFVRLSDNRLTVSGLVDTGTNAPISSLVSSTVRVEAGDGTSVPFTDATTWPLALAAVPGVPGAFDVVLPMEAVLEKGRAYYAVVFVNAGVGRRRTFRRPVQVVDG